MITLTGTATAAAVRTRLRAARERLGASRPLHQRLGGRLLAWVRRNFAARGRLLSSAAAGSRPGTAWPPLAPATLAARRRRGQGSTPLVATGRLRAGLRLRSDARRAVVDNPVPYAAAHQLGLGVPARPFLPGAAQARRIVHPVLERFAREALP